jgi:hypothetical protein
LTAGKIWVANRKDNIRAADRPYVEFHLADAWAKYLYPATGGVATTKPAQPTAQVSSASVATAERAAN